MGQVDRRQGRAYRERKAVSSPVPGRKRFREKGDSQPRMEQDVQKKSVKRKGNDEIAVWKRAASARETLPVEREKRTQEPSHDSERWLEGRKKRGETAIKIRSQGPRGVTHQSSWSGGSF